MPVFVVARLAYRLRKPAAPRTDARSRTITARTKMDYADRGSGLNHWGGPPGTFVGLLREPVRDSMLAADKALL
jgi:hypothetical protein